MRKLTKIILPEVGVENLKIRPRGDNRCESAKSPLTAALMPFLMFPTPSYLVMQSTR